MRSNSVDGTFAGEEGKGRSGDFSTGLPSSSRYLATLISSTAASFRLRRPGGTRLSNYRNSRGFIAANNLLTRFLRSTNFCAPKVGIFPETAEIITDHFLSRLNYINGYFNCIHLWFA